jgi:hypothetical protein
MRPGQTRNATLTAGYQRLGTLYDESQIDVIKSMDGQEIANSCTLTIKTADAQIAFGSSMPTVVGHTIAAGDTLDMGNQSYINRAWIRNDGSTAAVLIMTPRFDI